MSLVGEPYVPLETISENGGAAVASLTAATRAARHASRLPDSGTIPLQISPRPNLRTLRAVNSALTPSP